MSKLEAFTSQDISLVVEYNKIKRFQIKDQKDLKAGTYINFRETTALDSNYVPVIRVDGKPNKHNGLRSLHFEKAFNVNEQVKKNYYNPYAPWLLNGTQMGGIFADTLCGSNLAFKYNSRVKRFMKLLSQQGRFQQHCVMNSLPYTLETYNKLVEAINWDDYINCQYVNDR